MLSPTGRAVCAFLLVSLALVSFAFGLAQSQSTTVTTEVRINARQNDDGRVEFALQQREGAGWGEMMLLPGRFLPANVGHDRWLKTAPFTVSIDLPDAVEEVEEAPSGPCVLAEHTDRAAAATFQVQTDSATGTAFYIGRDEWITNHHVVEGASEVRLGRGDYTILATVIGSLPGYDLALLRAPAPYTVTALGFADQQQSLGANVSVLGYPPSVSGTPSLTRGVVSKHSPFSEFAGFSGSGLMVQIDAAINPGNSGGPMINDCGDVVGVATLKLFTTSDGRDIEGIGYGVSSSTVVAQLPALRVAAHVSTSVVSGGVDVDLSERIVGSERGGDLSWLHFVDEEIGPLTGVQVIGETDHPVWSKVKLVLSCFHEPGAAFVAIQVGAFASDTGEWVKTNALRGNPFTMSVYSTSPAPLDGNTWGFSVKNSEMIATSHDAATSFIETAMAHAKVAFRVGHVVSSIFGLVRLEGAFDTPVQHLLERCFME